MNRRQFLLRSASAMAATAAWPLRGAPAQPPLLAFFVIGDTHFLADGETPDQIDPTCRGYTDGLLKTLAQLPGTPFPETVGGGEVTAPAGLLHAGDLIDSGDKDSAEHRIMQQTEWAAYIKAFTVTAQPGGLPFPTYDIAGNHDSPHGTGYVIEQLAARQRTRQGLRALSQNGLHYSWDWAGVHFVALGLIVGNDPAVTRPRRYAALESLDFLKKDLAAHSAPDQPLILLHHVDVARYSDEKPGTDYTKREWDPADVEAFHAVLQGRRVALFHGHTHFRDIFHWDARRARGPAGTAVFNVSQASHHSSPRHAFFHVECHPGKVLVREYATSDGWATGAWTPQVWEHTW